MRQGGRQTEPPKSLQEAGRSRLGSVERARVISPLVPADDHALANNNFDALRLGLALLVVWSHSFALWYQSESGEWLSLLLNGTYNSGNIAVLGFFAISGFLITLSFRRSATVGSFFKKRVLRIYPGYIVAVLICSFVVVPLFSSRDVSVLSGSEIRGLLSNLYLRGYILPSDAFRGGAVNGSLWSIPFEFWCYLGVAALGLTGLIWRSWLFPLIAIVVVGTRAWLDLTGRQPGGGWAGAIIGFPYFWFAVLPPFVLGAAVLQWGRQIPRSRWIALLLIALLIVAAHLPIAPLPRLILVRTLLPFVLVYECFYLAFSPRWRLHEAARYGDFSYGTYLYAFPIQQMLGTTFRQSLSFASFVVLSAACSLLAGVVSWYLVERHFVRRTLKRASRRVLGSEAVIVAP